MKIQTLLSLLAVLALVGCATPTLNSKMVGISLGMTKQQVSELLGTPNQTATSRVSAGQDSGASEIHRYVEINGGKTDDFIVVFSNDKVAEYGPYVGSLRYRYDVFGQ